MDLAHWTFTLPNTYGSYPQPIQTPYFHIISKDKGFDPLIKHLKDRKIFCSRSASVLEIPLVKSTDKLPPRQRAADFYEKRIASAKARPATVMSLQSAILSHFQKMLSVEEVAEVLERLRQPATLW